MKYLLTLLLANSTAHAAEPATLRELVADLAVTFPRAEMQACARAHPDSAGGFEATASRFAARIQNLLADKAMDQTALAQTVPAEFIAFQAMMAGLSDEDFRVRTLQECRDRVQEFDALQDAELKDGLSETTKSLSDTLRTYRENMERAMGIEPTS